MGGICDEATLGPIVTKLTEPLEEQPRGSSEQSRGNGRKVDFLRIGRWWMFHPFPWNFWMIFFLKKDETFGRLNRDGFFRRILERWMFCKRNTFSNI